MPKTRLLYVGLAPTQNPRPFRLMQMVPEIDLTVLYLKPDSTGVSGDEYLNKSVFEATQHTGYRLHVAKPWGTEFSHGPLTGFSLDAWRFAAGSDIVVVYGHYLASYWLAMVAAKLCGAKLVLATDATYLQGSSDSAGWKLRLKPLVLRWLYNFWADAVCAASTASGQFLRHTGVEPAKIAITPYVVDEEMIRTASAMTDVPAMRAMLDIPLNSTVFIFCAKFLGRKRPADALRAFASISDMEATLLMVGSGPLESELHQLSTDLGIAKKVRFTGLVNYHELPAYYTAADVLVFCSDHEPYGLPVNEMMLCGRPVIVSDRIGARLDLVEEGITGWTYPARDVEALASQMRIAARDPGRLRIMGESARKKMLGWSSEVNVARQVEHFRARGWLKHD